MFDITTSGHYKYCLTRVVIYIMTHNYMPMRWLTLFVIVCISLMAPGAGAEGLYPTDAPALTASLSQQIPYPAHPGEEVTLVVKTTNSGDEPAKKIIWHLDIDDPFELKEAGKATQTLPELRGGETANTEYYLTVDPDARSGEYIIDLNITYSGDFDRKYLTTKSKMEITVRVQGSPDLVLLNADVPEAATKSEFDARFSIKNVGTGPAKDVKVSFANQTSILPKTSIRYIDTIAPGETAVVESSFFVDTTTLSQHPLQITILYDDEVHETQPVQSYSVLVPVVSGNTLFVYLDSQDKLTAGTVGEITIGVANRGLARAKHVSLVIEDDDGDGDGGRARFRLIDTSTRYIGDIESDDYDTVDFMILPQPDCRGVTVEVSYADDYGKAYKRTVDVPVSVYSPDEIRAISPKSRGYTWMIIGAIALLVIFVFRKRIKRIISR
ncbi:MAG TPA: hypothetical protein EYP67_00885 [Methanosarcinales archaeon]|nr:hypothetical protein [Methanosarcinales archaeon]